MPFLEQPGCLARIVARDSVVVPWSEFSVEFVNLAVDVLGDAQHVCQAVLSQHQRHCALSVDARYAVGVFSAQPDLGHIFEAHLSLGIFYSTRKGHVDKEKAAEHYRTFLRLVDAKEDAPAVKEVREMLAHLEQHGL